MLENFNKGECLHVFTSEIEICKKCFNDLPMFSLKVRKMRTRWGVCNVNSHVITLNLELIKRDTKYLDYVITHEIAHLKHGDHSTRFWNLVEDNMPDYKKYKKEMKEF